MYVHPKEMALDRLVCRKVGKGPLLVLSKAMVEFFEQLVGSLEGLSGNPWFYLAVFVIAVLDSVFPIVPSETVVILGGAAAGAGELSLVVVILVAATGALLGDCLAYAMGSRLGFFRRLIFRGEKGTQRIAGLGIKIADRGGLLLVTARFFPGGRTALTLACGMTRQPFLAWFLRWELVAVLVWANYAGAWGYFYGKRFDHGTAFLYAFGTALGITLTVEVLQRMKARKWTPM